MKLFKLKNTSNKPVGDWFARCNTQRVRSWRHVLVAREEPFETREEQFETRYYNAC